jgi:hypothetical protein
MHPTNRHRTASKLGSALLLALAAGSTPGLFAQADVFKANNNNALDLGTSWTGDAVPGALDIAVWNGSSTTTTVGTGLTVAGLRLGSSLTGNVSITGAFNGAAVTCDSGTDTITLAAHGLSNGQPLYLSGGTAPTGLSNTVTYFVVNATTDTFQLAATPGGAAINFTTNGSGVLIRGGGGSLAVGASGYDFSAAPAARTVTIASYSQLTANQTWTLGGNTDIVQVTHTGIITGSGSLTVGGTGLGILSLSAPNLFSGGLTLNPGGSVKIGGSTSVSGGAIISTAVGTGSLVINGGKVFGGADTGASSITIGGDFTVNSGTNANNGRAEDVIP